ncbi:Calmodulin [Euphorbia peplus]|nr:Calmodulin [Euphorbia peplus]
MKHTSFPIITYKITEISVAEEQLKKIFIHFDKNNDKILSKDEIKKAFEFLGSKCAGFRANRGIRQADVNGDGRVNWDELDHLVRFAAKIGYSFK